MKYEDWLAQIVEYRVEDRGSFVTESGKSYPDFRVVMYIDGEWKNEWDDGWSEKQANAIADRANTNDPRSLKNNKQSKN